MNSIVRHKSVPVLVTRNKVHTVSILSSPNMFTSRPFQFQPLPCFSRDDFRNSVHKDLSNGSRMTVRSFRDLLRVVERDRRKYFVQRVPEWSSDDTLETGVQTDVDGVPLFPKRKRKQQVQNVCTKKNRLRFGLNVYVLSPKSLHQGLQRRRFTFSGIFRPPFRFNRYLFDRMNE